MSRRRRASRSQRSFGFEVAMGRADPADRPSRIERGARACPHCGTTSRVDMVDVGHAYSVLLCPRCGLEWRKNEALSIDVAGLGGDRDPG